MPQSPDLIGTSPDTSPDVSVFPLNVSVVPPAQEVESFHVFMQWLYSPYRKHISQEYHRAILYLTCRPGLNTLKIHEY